MMRHRNTGSMERDRGNRKMQGSGEDTEETMGNRIAGKKTEVNIWVWGRMRGANKGNGKGGEEEWENMKETGRTEQ